MYTHYQHSLIKHSVFTVILFQNKLIPHTVNNHSCCGNHLWKPLTLLQIFDVHCFSLHRTVMAIVDFAKQMCFNPLVELKLIQDKSPASQSVTRRHFLCFSALCIKLVFYFSPQNQRGKRQLLCSLWKSVFFNKQLNKVSFSLERKKSHFWVCTSNNETFLK